MRIGITIIPIFQKRKLRRREAKWLAKVTKLGDGRSWFMHLDLLAPENMLLTTEL